MEEDFGRVVRKYQERNQEGCEAAMIYGRKDVRRGWDDNAELDDGNTWWGIILSNRIIYMSGAIEVGS